MPQGNNGELEQRQEEVRKAEEKVRYYDRLLGVPAVGAAAKTSSSSTIKEGMDLLREQRDVTLENIKESCQLELQRFIDARGSLDKKTGEIHLKLLSIYSSNSVATTNKIKAAHDLIGKMEQAPSFKALNDILENEPTNMDDDFTAVLGKCMAITQFVTEYKKPNSP
jgi:hypothetical protein